MKKWIFMVLCSVCIWQAAILSPGAAHPDYEKFGRIAIAVVQADYPEDEVTDYEYQGRKNVENAQVEDDFAFVVKEKGKQLTVIVKVQHDLENKKMLQLRVMEKK